MEPSPRLGHSNQAVGLAETKLNWRRRRRQQMSERSELKQTSPQAAVAAAAHDMSRDTAESRVSQQQPTNLHQSASVTTLTDNKCEPTHGQLYLFQQNQRRRSTRPAASLLCWSIGLVITSSILIDCLVIQIKERPRTHPASHKRDSTDFIYTPKAAAAAAVTPTQSTNTTQARVFKRQAAAREDQRTGASSSVDALAYLQRYGYMNETNGNANLISEDSYHEAVMTFQRFAGIPETGVVDSQTVKYMQMPRCGNKDQSGKGESGKKRRRRRRKKRKRRKRYALQGSKWKRQELTYRISQYPTRFLGKKHEVDAQIEKAFKIWSQVAPVDFVVRKEGRVHIDIRFASGEHGDGDPFDGPGNTLAHAYFPQYGGDAHFDDQEYWTVDSYSGTNIFQVAAHELGHSLGLGHSSVREALMAPFYQKYKPNFKLHSDDVQAIQALYGERDADQDSSSGSTSTTSTTTTSTESSRRRPTTAAPDDTDYGGRSRPTPPDLCQDSKIDAITRTEDGNTYVFRGAYYWQIKNEGLASGYPAKISRDWDGLPGNLDAALTWSDGKTFFFKGDKYWRFFNKRREPGYPKLISAGFAGIPNDVDAAFVWGGNGKTYFFKRDKYWRFDSKQEPPVSSQYPKSIKNWSGLPSGIDDAFKWDNGMTYFFKDDVYYRFDDREFEVDQVARPSFPRSTAEWWFGCTNSNLPIKQRPAASAANDESDNNDESSANDHHSSSSLMFHRKPNLIYETAPANNPQPASRSKPVGGDDTASTSILSSLADRWLPKSLRDLIKEHDNKAISTALANIGSQSDDWSYHRGVVEEARRSLNKALSSSSSSSNGDTF